MIEDGAHEYETTIAGLRDYAGLVEPGGYFVVEDGVVDAEALRLARTGRAGCCEHRRLARLARRRGLRDARDLEIYGITSHPYGFLRRRA